MWWRYILDEFWRINICYSLAGRSLLGKTVPEVLSTARVPCPLRKKKWYLNNILEKKRLSAAGSHSDDTSCLLCFVGFPVLSVALKSFSDSYQRPWFLFNIEPRDIWANSLDDCGTECRSSRWKDFLYGLPFRKSECEGSIEEMVELPLEEHALFLEEPSLKIPNSPTDLQQSKSCSFQPILRLLIIGPVLSKKLLILINKYRQDRNS